MRRLERQTAVLHNSRKIKAMVVDGYKVVCGMLDSRMRLYTRKPLERAGLRRLGVAD